MFSGISLGHFGTALGQRTVPEGRVGSTPYDTNICSIQGGVRMVEEALPAGIHRHGRRYRVQKMVDGTLVRRGFATLEEAEAFLEQLRERVRDRDAPAIPDVLTVMDVVRTWWLGPLIDGEHRGGHRRRVASRTARDYQQYIDRYISQIGGEPVAGYTRNPALLKLFYDSLPNRMAWHVHGVLRLAFKEAVARGHMERNPCLAESPARRKRTRRLTPSRPEVDRIITTAEDEDARWGLFVYLTATLGTRCGETCALCSEDFDEAAHTVHIERAVSKTAGGPILKEPKKGEPRDLFIDDPDFWGYVRPALREPGFLFPGFHRDEQHKGAGAQPKPWHPDHAQARFRKMIRSLGLPPYTLHSLRHFVATQLLIEGQPVNQVAEFLGHTPQMTLMLYGRHLDREAMRRVGRAAVRVTSRPAPCRDAAAEAETAPLSTEALPRAAPGYAWSFDLICEMAERGPVTNAAVRAKTGLTRRQISKALDRLVRDGRLRREGENRGTRYLPT